MPCTVPRRAPGRAVRKQSCPASGLHCSLIGLRRTAFTGDETRWADNESLQSSPSAYYAPPFSLDICAIPPSRNGFLCHRISAEGTMCRRKGLAAGTAYEILSIDIADVDVDENVGAKLQIAQANADKQIAQAKAPRDGRRRRAGDADARRGGGGRSAAGDGRGLPTRASGRDGLLPHEERPDGHDHAGCDCARR